MIVKYPPIEGGVSVQGYWLARGLADRGHQVLVVTNAREVEPAYRLAMTRDDDAGLEHEGNNGGWVRVRQSGDQPRRYSHIPHSSAFVSKLASIAAEECAAVGGVDVLFANYLEPYAVAASLVSQWTGVPYVVQPAGSDRTRLMGHPDLGYGYVQVLRGAARVISADARLRTAGISPAQLVSSGIPALVPVSQFRAAAPADIGALLGADRGEGPAFDPAVPTIGAFGKVGETKGSFDLVHALASVSRAGRRFNLVFMGAGGELAQVRDLARRLGIADRLFEIPPQPHWRVASFLKACTAVCVLERDFPVEIHRPRTVGEVLLSGTCAVLSGEMAAKQRTVEPLRDGENAVVVADPKRHDDLARRLTELIDDPSLAAWIGSAGAAAYRPDPMDDVLDSYDAVFRQAAGSAPGVGPQSAPPSGPAGAASTDVTAELAGCRQQIGDQVADESRRYLDQAGAGWEPRGLEQWLLGHCPAFGADVAVSDLLGLEILLVWAAAGSSSDAPREFPAYPGSFDLHPGADLSRTRPVASQWTRSRTFATDAVRRRGDLLAGRDATVRPGECRSEGYTVLVHRTRSLIPRTRSIDRRYVRLLAECDGTRTRETLRADLAATGFGTPEEIEERLTTLSRAGLIVHR